MPLGECNRPFSIYEINSPQFEALGNKYRACGVYSLEPRAELYRVRLNFNISKLIYLKEVSNLPSGVNPYLLELSQSELKLYD